MRAAAAAAALLSLGRCLAYSPPAAARFPPFLHSSAADIVEPAAIEVLQSMKRVTVEVPTSISSTGTIDTNYVCTSQQNPSISPLLLLHGFDSSLIEWRRLLPLLGEEGAALEAWAVDILGWGWTELSGVNSFSPDAKVQHLHSFWKQAMGGRPATLVGASLGGTVAIEFAHRYPEAVEKLILVDAQGFIDGSGPGAMLPDPIARLGVKVLGSKPLRMMANKMAYHDEKVFATEEAMNIGRLHTLQEGWEDALMSFMKSGGFAVSSKVPLVEKETLVLWGRQDAIIDPVANAERFVQEMKNARLEWIDECGHVPHLEQPREMVGHIRSFMQRA